ncbi:3-dehydroquinate synthase family protein [Streptomyces niveus]|uniref:3-dehydroquinate synthase n=1 Tax=Streptomyces niveus TaxID=193462 RepID=UPI0036ADC43E
MTSTAVAPLPGHVEGIRVEPLPDGLLAHVTRRDTTRITINTDGLGATIADLGARGAHFVVDENVHGARQDVRRALPTGRHTVVHAGERNKTLDSVGRLVTELHESGAHRRAPLVAVGGGVTCDIVGLTAALYFRGVPAVLVPTSLLAMVDAAVGGKTGVNHPRQKNLMGTFSHPAEVRIHLDALDTLPRSERVSAYGEVLKIAVADDPDLFAVLEAGQAALDDPERLRNVVRTCVSAKLRLLGDNAFERDLARTLNLGHTVAHPLEDITAFRVPHGAAVAIGIAVASHIAHHRLLLDEWSFTRILNTVQGLGLPLMDAGFDPAALIERVDGLRLQRGGSSLHYVLPTGIGSTVFSDDVTSAELRAATSDLRTRQEAR